MVLRHNEGMDDEEGVAQMLNLFVVASIAALSLGQVQEGAVTSTDLGGSGSVSEKAPASQDTPEAAPKPVEEKKPEMKEETELESVESKSSADKQKVNPPKKPARSVGKREKGTGAVAAFWVIMPE